MFQYDPKFQSICEIERGIITRIRSIGQTINKITVSFFSYKPKF